MSRHVFNGVVGDISPLPGCSQVAVSHGVFAPPHARGKGCAKLANRERQSFCFNEMFYDYMICTVDGDNKVQLRVLQTTGWHKLDAFVSRKTGHYLEIWGKNKY